MSGYLEAILVLLALNVVLAYSASLPLFAGQLNLGIAGFMAIGAYVGAYLTNERDMPLWLAVAAGAAVPAAVALAVGLPILRTQGIYLALATLAFGELVRAILLNLEVVGGASGYPVLAYAGSGSVWILAAGVTAVMFVLSRTRFLLYLTAIRNDPTVADLFGLNVKALQLGALALGAAFAGAGGAIYAHHFSFIEAQYFDAALNINIVLFVILGGTQTVIGPLVGAAFFTLLPEVLRAGAEWRFVIFAAFIILFMAIRPEGIVTAALLRALRRRLLRGREEGGGEA